MSAKWRKGPPPSVGWWPTRLADDSSSHVFLRWWNGRHWSCGAHERSPVTTAVARAKQRNGFPDSLIAWSDRPANWPARSFT